jgi:Arm DNA-binding domain
MSLSKFAISKARTKDKPLTLSDGDGLHLLVTPGGSKLWRFRYRFGGRENMLALGAYPAVSLADARSKRDEARKLLADGKDPAVKRLALLQFARVRDSYSFWGAATDLAAASDQFCG